MALRMSAFRQQRRSRREVLGIAAGVVACPGWAMAAPAASKSTSSRPASPWSESTHSALRLLDGGAAPGGHGLRLAGIELRLRAGFKTYWRHPGDSGVPPVFDFAGSVNLQEAKAHYPAPKRFSDGAGGMSFGYAGEHLLLPLTVQAIDPAAPVMLRLRADYAVCDTLCVPANGSAELALRGAPTLHTEAIRRAMEAVPRPAALGAPGALRILGLRRGSEPGRFFVEVEVPHERPGGAAPELFIEAPQPWYIETSGFEPAALSEPARFVARAAERAPAPAAAALTLTLVAGSEAIEAAATLDSGLIEP